MPIVEKCPYCKGIKRGGGGYAHTADCPEVTGAMAEIVGPAERGWQCPNCHGVYAPSVEQCPHCAPAEKGDVDSGPVEHL